MLAEELLDTGRSTAASPHSPPGENEAQIVPQDVLEDLDEQTDGLSGREVEDLLQVARGKCNQLIAASLHLANTYGKIGVNCRTGAAQNALANGWISSFELSENYEGESKGRPDPLR